MIDRLKKFIIDWNNQFPFDRLYREKFNIAFNSTQHRELNQIDIKLFFLESFMFNNYEQQYIEERRNMDNYLKNGVILKDLPVEKVSELFDAIDMKNFKKANGK